MRATLPTNLAEREDLDWESIDFLESEPGWTEEQYLRIDVNRIIEYVDGCLDVPPVPDAIHQMLVWLLTSTLNHHLINGKAGRALCASFRLQIPNGNWREPDVLYLLPKNLHRQQRESWDYADLVIEMVSLYKPQRDYRDKRLDYAEAGVPEYWIVDPRRSQISVLVLDGAGYREAQIAREGDVLRSIALPGLEVDVKSLFDKARE